MRRQVRRRDAEDLEASLTYQAVSSCRAESLRFRLSTANLRGSFRGWLYGVVRPFKQPEQRAQRGCL